jgi:hypothetical protein
MSNPSLWQMPLDVAEQISFQHLIEIAPIQKIIFS